MNEEDQNPQTPLHNPDLDLLHDETSQNPKPEFCLTPPKTPQDTLNELPSSNHGPEKDPRSLLDLSNEGDEGLNPPCED